MSHDNHNEFLKQINTHCFICCYCTTLGGWWVQLHEYFSGLHKVAADCLLWLNTTLAKVRGQCYDEASTMTAIKKELQQFHKKNSLLLILLTSMAILWIWLFLTLLKKKVHVNTYEITELAKHCSCRQGIVFSKVEGYFLQTVGIHVLCPTRWTVHWHALYYKSAPRSWDEAAQIVHNIWLNSLCRRCVSWLCIGLR